MEFEGKAAIVTGASGGLGRAIAVALGTAGAQVGLVARSREGREETRRLIGQPDARVFCTDLRDEQAIAQLGAFVTANLGPVDILVNCAGVWHDERTRFHGPRLLETSVELREHKIQVPCIAPVFVATDAVRRFYASEIQSEQALDPLDVAQLALFLLSSRADHISGQVIAVRSKDDHG